LKLIIVPYRYTLYPYCVAIWNRHGRDRENLSKANLETKTLVPRGLVWTDFTVSGFLIINVILSTLVLMSKKSFESYDLKMFKKNQQVS
jgi:hypothetical protein